MGAVLSGLQELGPLALPFLAGAGILAALALDRVLRMVGGVVLGLVAIELFDAMRATISTFGGPGMGLLPILAPLSTAATMLICLFALARPAPRPAGAALWLGGLLFLASGIVTDLIVLGRAEQHSFEMLLVLSAVWAARELPPATVVAALKVAVGAAVALSILSVAVGAPGASEAYTGFLPIDIRASGITGHANRLGPLALLALVLEYIRRSPGWWHPAMVAGAGMLLLLSQSKTAWAMAVFVASVLVARRVGGGRVARTVTLVSIAAAIAVVWTGLEPATVLPSDDVDRLTSLTGRTTVWQVGVESWLEGDRVFGNGSGVFREYAARTGRTWAGQAHNQLIQTVAENGALGAVGLLAYVGALMAAARRTRDVSAGASIALVGALLLQSFTETPLDSFRELHFSVVVLLFTWSRQVAAEERRPGAASTGVSVPPVPVGAGTGSPRTSARGAPHASGRTASIP